MMKKKLALDILASNRVLGLPVEIAVTRMLPALSVSLYFSVKSLLLFIFT
jgi:hypothetical protein